MYSLLIRIYFLFILIAFTVDCYSDESNNKYDSTATMTVNPLTTKVILQPWPPNSTVCYEYVGCFSNNAPFNNTALYLPIDPILINTQFLLFTKRSPNNGRFVSYRETNTIISSNFDRNLPLKVVVHGFFNDINSPWMYIMKDALLTDDVNVLLVGWGNGAQAPFYNNASSNIRVVGKELSLIVNSFKNVFYPTDWITNLKIHCIGHSLGSHICGHAGYFSKAYNIYFDRISGMDPAGPFFENQNELVRLDPSDAKFVDIYHVNAQTAGVGYVGAIGHADFYINGGGLQPGCSTVSSCSHSRIYEYYTESIISSCTFVSFKCETYDSFLNGNCRTCNNGGCTTMGYYADQYKSKGTFYSITLDKPPYCGNQYMLTMKISSDSQKTAGEIIFKFQNDSYSLTKVSDDIKPNTDIKTKVFLLRADIKNGDIASIYFNKKPKPIWPFSDSNAPNFTFESLQVVNLLADEKLSICNGKFLINDKETVYQKFDLKQC